MTDSEPTPTLPLEYPDRAAPDLLGGILYQVLWAACRWFELGSDEILVCEGDEDLVRETIRDGRVVELSLEQIKQLSSRLTARSPAVYETVFAFLCSYEVHAKADRLTSFVFTTSARRGTQQKDKPGAAGSLTADLLVEWAQLAPASSDDAVKSVAANVRALVEAYAAKAFPTPGPDHKGPKPSITEKRIRDAVTFLDAAPERWRAFLTGTRWNLEQDTRATLLARLTSRVARDARSSDLPADLFALRLLFEALRVGSEPEVSDRVLSAASLAQIAHTSRAGLEAWAAQTQATHLWPLCFAREFESVKGDVAELRKTVEALLRGDSPAAAPESVERYRSITAQDTSVLSMVGVNGSALSIDTAWSLSAKWLDEEREFPVARLSASAAHAVLLSAPPGWGKSTALRLVAHAALVDPNALPARVSLRHVASYMSSGVSFPMALAQEVGERSGFPEPVARSLVASITLLLADGLDECGASLGAVADGLEAFARAHPEVRVVVTTRDREAAGLAPDFRRAALVGLASHQVTSAAETLLKAIAATSTADSRVPPSGSPNPDDREVLRRFRLIVERLGGEPTFLLITVALHLARWRDTVPTTRYELFEQFLEVVRSRPVADRPTEDPGAALAQLALARVAWKQTDSRVLAWSKATEVVRVALLPSEGAVKAARMGDACLRFWEARGVLARVPVTGLECVEFAHEELRSFAAAGHLAELSSEERQAWLAGHGRAEAEIVEFAAQRGGDPVVSDLFVAFATGTWEAFLAKARGLAATREARPEFAAQLAAESAPLLGSDIADVAARTLDAVLPIVPRAPEPFARAARRVLSAAPAPWNVLVAHRVLLEAGEPLVDADALLRTMRERLAPAPAGAETHDTQVEWALWNGLLVPAIEYLGEHAKTAEVDALVERIALERKHISAGTMQEIFLILPKLGYSELLDRVREKHAGAAKHSGKWMRDSWLGDLAFLVHVGAAFKGEPPTERVDTSALARLLGALDFGNAMTAEWCPGLATADPAAVRAVLRGVACALGLRGADLLGEVPVALSTTVPSTEPAGIYLGLLQLARQDPDEPDWSRSAALNLRVDDLFRALLASGSVLPRCAGELLAHHRDQATVRLRFMPLLNQPPDDQARVIALHAPQILGEDAPDLIAATLERALTSTNAVFLLTLVHVQPESRRTAQLVERALANSCGEVVLRAIQALKGVSAPAHSAAALKRTVAQWAAWARGEGPLQELREGAVVCGTTLHAEGVLRQAFQALAEMASLSLDELVVLRKEKALVNVATEALVELAGGRPEALAWLLDQIEARALDSDVFEMLLEHPPVLLASLGERVLAFAGHASPEMRGVLIRALAKAKWLPREKAKEVLERALKDPVAELRSDASRALRGEANTGLARRLRRAGTPKT